MTMRERIHLDLGYPNCAESDRGESDARGGEPTNRPRSARRATAANDGAAMITHREEDVGHGRAVARCTSRRLRA